MNLLQSEKIIFSFNLSVLNEGHSTRHNLPSLPKTKKRFAATQLLFQPLNPSWSHSRLGCLPLSSTVLQTPWLPPSPFHSTVEAHLTTFINSIPPRGDAYVGTRAKKEWTEPVKPNCCSIRHSWARPEPSQLGSGQVSSLRDCWNLHSSCLLAVLVLSLLFPNKIFVSCCPGFSQDSDEKFFCSSQERTWLWGCGQDQDIFLVWPHQLPWQGKGTHCSFQGERCSFSH